MAIVNTTARNGTFSGIFGGGNDLIRDANCEARSGANVIGGATDRRVIPAQDSAKRSLAINGGAVTADGGELSVWCRSQLGANESVDGASLMIMQVGGFF